MGVRRLVGWSAPLVAAGCLASLAGPPAQAAPRSSGSAVGAASPVRPAAAKVTYPGVTTAFQGDAAHDGAVTGAVGAPPLRRSWTRTLEGRVTTTLVAEGRVFVIAVPQSGPGVMLHALDPRTGRDLWKPVVVARADNLAWAGASYGDGRLYVADADANLMAVKASTGAVVWRLHLPDQSFVDAAPTFAQGRVYVQAFGYQSTVYGLAASTGRLAWRRTVRGGNASSPVVVGGTVYVSGGCEYTTAFDAVTGRQRWHVDAGCYGGGGRTPAATKGGLWVRDISSGDPARELDLRTGRVIATFPAASSTQIPAFSGSRMFVVTEGVLTARAVTRPARVLWTFRDGNISLPPLVVDGVLYALNEFGRLYAISTTTGKAVWRTDTGSRSVHLRITADDNGQTALAAGGGYLLVPTGNVLSSYTH